MFSCNYDNKECSYGLKPWQNCTDRQGGVYCRKVFKNGICDPQCNNQNCLYDGFDCEGEMKRCNTFYEKYCQEHYANGYCDQGCNSSECEWDGLDCDTSPKQLARGTLIIIVLVKAWGVQVEGKWISATARSFDASGFEDQEGREWWWDDLPLEARIGW